MTQPSSESKILKTAIATWGHTSPLKNGSIKPNGIEFDFVEVEPIIAAFRRMVRDTEFDVCEMSPSTYLCAKAHNKPFTAIPVFLHRMFHDNALVYNVKSGIKTPNDLEGKKVGVRAYTVATGIWVRELLQTELGVDINKVNWVTDDEDHVTEWQAPPNVSRSPDGKSLIDLLLDAEIDASFTGPAGVGRSGAPAAGWDAGGQGPTRKIEDSPDVKPLPPEVGQLEVDRFHRSGVYPIHGVVVVKDSLLASDPWVAVELFNAFKQAKEDFHARLKDQGPSSPIEERSVGLQKIVGGDPNPYGIEANRSSIEALLQCAFDQKLTTKRYDIEEVFASNTLDLV